MASICRSGAVAAKFAAGGGTRSALPLHSVLQLGSSSSRTFSSSPSQIGNGDFCVNRDGGDVANAVTQCRSIVTPQFLDCCQFHFMDLAYPWSCFAFVTKV